MLAFYSKSLRAAFVIISFLAIIAAAHAQSASNSTSVTGTVLDPSGAVIPNATVDIRNPVSGFERTTTTNSSGYFFIPNVPFNPYHMRVIGEGFAPYIKDIDVRSVLPLNLSIGLKLQSSETVTVESGAEDLIENDSTFHTDVDRNLFNKVPLESQSSSLTSLVTLTTPGVAADSNGLFHGIGDHAENSFSVDGQPVTDQVSKVFSNQLPVDSVQSLQVIDGAPPAEYGGKTSVVIVTTTRSGQGMTTPHGSVTASYGSFGTSNVDFNLGYGGAKWGNFITANALNTGRFLDPPEFKVLHDKGNQQNIFDRLDFQASSKSSLHLNLQFTRSWFQTPNTWDQELQTCTVLAPTGDCNAAGTTVVNPPGTPLAGQLLGPTDQRSQIRTFNIAPAWTYLLSSNSILTVGAYVRHDQYNYYPSGNPFSDLGALQDESVSQLRFLTNAGLRGDWTYVKGIHNVKIGATYGQTFLTENDSFGIVNPGLLPGFSCPNPPPNSPVSATQCAALAPYDLTGGGTFYHYRAHTDVKELAMYAEDTITKGSWTVQAGLRGDFYNGLDAISRQPEPRVGVAYNVKPSNTVLRVSYARTMESPFNENLVLSGTGCLNPVVNAIMVVAQGFACTTSPLRPGYRNEFHAGLEQAFSKYFVLSGEYIWKYTHNGYDFNVFGTTPITLPIEWHNSKISGFAIRGSIPNYHGFSALIVMSHVAARFFPPTVAGIAPPAPPAVFRIDHDEAFNQTTHLQYQIGRRGPWVGFNWRYDSGLVSGFVPCLAATATCSFTTSTADGGANKNLQAGQIALLNNLNGLPLTADQEFQSGLTCNGVRATPTTYIGSPVPGQPYNYCLASQLTSSLVKIPAPGTEQDEKNPQRIQPRHLFDLAIGHDNIFHGDRYKWSANLTVVNLANRYALYNFLSTFSGTHYVTPRTVTAQAGFNF